MNERTGTRLVSRIAGSSRFRGRPEEAERDRQPHTRSTALLHEELAAAGIASRPSHTNFGLVELGTDDGPVCAELIRRGLLIRPGTEFGLPGFARVTLAPAPVMRRTAAAIAAVVAR